KVLFETCNRCNRSVTAKRLQTIPIKIMLLSGVFDCCNRCNRFAHPPPDYEADPQNNWPDL
ncbi:hypothetical protein IML05_003495, partial [Escherichia coli]